MQRFSLVIGKIIVWIWSNISRSQVILIIWLPTSFHLLNMIFYRSTNCFPSAPVWHYQRTDGNHIDNIEMKKVNTRIWEHLNTSIVINSNDTKKGQQLRFLSFGWVCRKQEQGNAVVIGILVVHMTYAIWLCDLLPLDYVLSCRAETDFWCSR